MTSPPALVAREPHVPRLTLFLMNLTEPSRKPTFTPPEWFELAPTMVRSGCGEPLPTSFEKTQLSPFGAMMWL
jgi:hypothetical protein